MRRKTSENAKKDLEDPKPPMRRRGSTTIRYNIPTETDPVQPPPKLGLMSPREGVVQPSMAQPPASSDKLSVSMPLRDKSNVDEGDDDYNDDEFRRDTITEWVDPPPVPSIPVPLTTQKKKPSVTMPSVKHGPGGIDDGTDDDKAAFTGEFHVSEPRKMELDLFAGEFGRFEDIRTQAKVPEFALLENMERFLFVIMNSSEQLLKHSLPFLQVDKSGKLVVDVVSVEVDKSDPGVIRKRLETMFQMLKFIHSSEEVRTRFKNVYQLLKLVYLYIVAVLSAKRGEEPDFKALKDSADKAFDVVSVIDFRSAPELEEKCRYNIYQKWAADFDSMKWFLDGCRGKEHFREWLESEDPNRNKTQKEMGTRYTNEVQALVGQNANDMMILLMEPIRKKPLEAYYGFIPEGVQINEVDLAIDAIFDEVEAEIDAIMF